MPRYKVLIEYDGTKFHGFQRQKDLISVQGLMESSLLKIAQENVTVHGSGRTDTGVHAIGQVTHFDLVKNISPFKLREGLNYYMSENGCSVLDVSIASDDFHARFQAKSRIYIYKILNRRPPSPLYDQRVWHIKNPLNIDLMKEAAQYFIGRHDFSAFRCVHCQVVSPIKTMEKCDIVEHNDLIEIHISSRSFLHNQVRIMVGTLVEIGLGKKKPIWIKQLLEAGDRKQSGQTAPPYGLYFAKVTY